MRTFTSREDWLRACLTRVTAGWPAGSDLPENTRISVGFPLERNPQGGIKEIAHYRPSQSDGGVYEIFVAPTLGDSLEVARAVAIEASRIATQRDPDPRTREALNDRARRVVETLPPYPHKALKVEATGRARAIRPAGAPRPGSRLIKAQCTGCGYIARTTRKWITTVGPPVCPAHGPMVTL